MILLSAGESEEQVENSDLGNRGPEPSGEAALGNLINSAGRGQSAELLTGGGVGQPGRTCANGAADGRKSFSEHLLPWPPAGI